MSKCIMFNVFQYGIDDAVRYLGSQLLPNVNERFEWSSTELKRFDACAGSTPVLVYETEHPRNLKLWSLLELESAETTETWIPVFPKWTPLHKELGGCDFELLHDLCFESNTILKQETQEKRQSEKQNVLLSWKDKERIFILHTTGSIGETLSFSEIAGFSDPSHSELKIETRNDITMNGFSQHQLKISETGLAALVNDAYRLIASRSFFGIHIVALMNPPHFNLKWIASIQHGESRITDMQFSPFTFPELIFCCTDGSLFIVDLQPILDTSETIKLEAKKIDQPDIDGCEAISSIRCRCIYGYHPRQILLSKTKTLTFFDLSSGRAVVETELQFQNEELKDIQTTSVTSPLRDRFLVVVLTDKKIRLYDLRTLPDTLLLWDIRHGIAKPESLFFILEQAYPQSEDKRQLGRIIFGDFAEGNFDQAAFLIGDAPLSLSVEKEQNLDNPSIHIRFVKRRKTNTDLPVLHTRYRLFLDGPTSFCDALCSHDDDYHSKTVHLPRFIYRLHQKTFQTQRALPARDVTRWKAFLKRHDDVLGFAFVPMDALECTGWLIRMNPIGDLVVDQVMPRTQQKRDNLRRSWIVLPNRDEEMQNLWPTMDGCIDVDVFDLDCMGREWIFRRPKELSTALKIRYSIPPYLLSANFKLSIGLSTSRNVNPTETRTFPPLPLIYHWKYFQKLSSRNRILNQALKDEEEIKRRIHQRLSVETGSTLWNCFQSVLCDDDFGERAEGTIGTPTKNKVRRMISRVDMKLSEKRVEAFEDMLLQDGESIVDGKAVEQQAMTQIETVVKTRMKKHKAAFLPPVFASFTEGFLNSESWKACDLEGTDVVFLPIENSKSRNDVKITFHVSQYQPLVSVPSLNERENVALRKMEDLWNQDWNRILKGT